MQYLGAQHTLTDIWKLEQTSADFPMDWEGLHKTCLGDIKK